MTGPDDPQYPDPQYPQQYPGPQYPQQDPGTAHARRPGSAAGLGDRAARRPEPRLGVSLAGAGIGLMIVGIIVWGGDYASSGGGGSSDGGGSHRFLGMVLALLVVIAGYTLAINTRRGPLTTAGVVAGALGIPVVLAFLTLGQTSDFPFSLDAVVLVSVLAWVVSYLAVPGARGHSFLLAASAVLLWIYVLDKIEPDVFGLAFFLPTISLGGSGLSFSSPNLTTVASMSLVFGLGYYAIAFALDRAGRRGTATAFVVAAVPAVDVGVALISRDLKQIGTGVLTIAIGLVVGAYAARYGRRLTTWISVSGAASGVVLIVVKLAGDNAAAGGIALMVVGAAVVAGGAAAAKALREPDDMELATTTAAA